MDEQARVHDAVANSIQDFVEGGNNRLEIRLEEFQREVRSGF